jgi:hypothetical protein
MVDFAVLLSALLDGLAVQIALGDPVVTPARAFELCMRFAAGQLGFGWEPGGGRERAGAGSRAGTGSRAVALSGDGGQPPVAAGTSGGRR